MWGRGITEHCVKVNYNSVVRGYAPSRNVLNLGSLKLLLEPVADEIFLNVWKLWERKSQGTSFLYKTLLNHR